MCVKMAANKKTIITVLLSAFVGSVLGGVVVGFTVLYFIGQFFGDATSLASSNQLNFNIWALESLRAGNETKAIKQLENEARTNLVTVNAFESDASIERKEELLRAIANAKQYFEKYPFEYMDENEKIAIEQAFSKVESNSHNKSHKSGTPKSGAP